MKSSKLQQIFSISIIASVLIFMGALVAFAGDPPNKPAECSKPVTPQDVLKCAAWSSGLPYKVVTPQALSATIINSALSIVGIIAVIAIILAGIMWLGAGGNEERAESAKKILGTALVGLGIILSAYILAKFAITTIKQSTLDTIKLNVGEYVGQPLCINIPDASCGTTCIGQVIVGDNLCPSPLAPVCCKSTTQ